MLLFEALLFAFRFCISTRNAHSISELSFLCFYSVLENIESKAMLQEFLWPCTLEQQILFYPGLEGLGWVLGVAFEGYV